LKRFFDLLYNQFAWAYDFVANTVSLGMWKSWVLATLPYVQGSRVLEIGHGPGHLLLALYQAGIRAVGLDLSERMGSLVLRRLGFAGFRFLGISGYAQYTPFADHCFDTICSTFPSEYILDPKTLSEISRLLAPGGKLVILPLAWITRKNILGRLAAFLFRFTGQAPQWDDAYAQPLIDAGFRVRIVHHKLASSEVLILLASRESPDSL
jgi:ubiquinone/menaquinone biosynthesis C-methylase UbiE